MPWRKEMQGAFARHVNAHSQIPTRQFAVLACFAVNLAVGPLMWGPVVSANAWGVFFPFGVVYAGRLIVDPMCSLFTVAYLVLWLRPLTALVVCFHSSAADVERERPRKTMAWLAAQIVVCFGVLVFLVLKYYGFLTALISPGVSWLAVATVGLLHYARNAAVATGAHTVRAIDSSQELLEDFARAENFLNVHD